MGDHQIGRAMGIAAEAYLRGFHKRKGQVITQKQALSTLDLICSRYAGRDAEFESEDPNNPGHIHPDYSDYTNPNGPLGQLIAIAFNATEEEKILEDEETTPWYDGPYTKFKDRYRFC